MRRSLAALMAPVLLAAPVLGQQPQVERAVRAQGRPAPLKVIVRRPTTIYREPNEQAAQVRPAHPMEFFFVLPVPGGAPDDYKVSPSPQGWWYRITTREVAVQGTQYGYVRSVDMTEWWHRQAVGFLPRGVGANATGRQRVRFFATPQDWADGFAQPEDARPNKARAIEPERLGNAGFVMPVLDVKEDEVWPVDNSQYDLYQVAFIAAEQVPEAAVTAPGSTEPAAPLEGLASLADLQVELAFCVDESGSMGPYIAAVNEAIQQISAQLRADHPDLQDRFRFALVTFGASGAAKIRCTFEQGKSAEGFAAAVRAVQASGGGEDGEDVLTGVQLAVKSLDWGELAMKSILLVGDECGYDEANHPELNASKTTIDELRSIALPVDATLSQVDAFKACRTIDVAEIMGTDNGEALSALRSRQFQALAGRNSEQQLAGEHWQLDVGNVAQLKARVVDLLKSRIQAARAIVGVAEAAASGGDAAGAASVRRLLDNPEFARTPKPFVELMVQLGPADTSALTDQQQAWIANADMFGVVTVSERFLITRVRLQRLKQMLEMVGTELDQPGVSATSLVTAMQQRIASTSIDQDISPQTSLKDVFEIVGGLPIQTPLMALTPEQAANHSPADRRRLVEKLQSMTRSAEAQLGQADLWFKLDEGDDDRDALAFISIDDFR